ncbi:hypothetical protein LV780_11895 [Cereibacter azotoformans]|uniref:hypothetical protein n=1 Tax=Cereibacter azotoformans TaxID=43057 RepID=UPI000D347EF6|nr:hypothetical protein [Cereibacter azotoformans]AXQ94452.1 hypothetical protein D0Z66_11920 [Cereibacter sphaeroides]MBO4170713.1 hypothetical protein [Cereibacter azotoformans]UIJ29999.1 hypothetical protein LV780_11895 [Cereibacter azotoformans]
MKTIVTFIRPWNRYNRGETAGFNPATAAGLIGVHAVPYRPDGRRRRKPWRPHQRIRRRASDPPAQAWPQ